MRQPAIADAGTATPEADPHAVQVPSADRLAVGVEEVGPSELPKRPCVAGQPRPVKSLPVTRIEEDKVRVIDAGGLGHLGVPVAMLPEVGGVRV